MNKYISIIITTLFVNTFLSCEKTTENAVDNTISNTNKEVIKKRWDDKIDSVSYAIGLDVAMRLNQQFDNFNYVPEVLD